MKDTKEYWKEKAVYLAAMVALVPVQDRILPDVEAGELDFATDILAQYPPLDKPRKQG